MNLTIRHIEAVACAPVGATACRVLGLIRSGQRTLQRSRVRYALKLCGEE